jgi:hypothetical protein
MKRFIEGGDRNQTTLLPGCLDDYVDDRNPVRAIDAFVELLYSGATNSSCWKEKASNDRQLNSDACSIAKPPLKVKTDEPEYQIAQTKI